MSSAGSNTGASQRASEITSAMLNVPGYADDSMLFMMRYGALAKVCYDLIYDFFFLSPPLLSFFRLALPHWDPFSSASPRLFLTRPFHHNHKNARSPYYCIFLFFPPFSCATPCSTE